MRSQVRRNTDNVNIHSMQWMHCIDCALWAGLETRCNNHPLWSCLGQFRGSPSLKALHNKNQIQIPITLRRRTQPFKMYHVLKDFETTLYFSHLRRFGLATPPTRLWACALQLHWLASHNNKSSFYACAVVHVGAARLLLMPYWSTIKETFKINCLRYQILFRPSFVNFNL